MKSSNVAGSKQERIEKVVDIYLVGTDHSFQTGEGVQKHDIESFKIFLSDIIQLYGIKSIAEEMSCEALTEAQVNESTCKIVARELCLPHKYCDPDRKARKKLGILQINEVRLNGYTKGLTDSEITRRNSLENGKREKIWIEIIKKLDKYPLLFVCGANHTIPFSERITNSGLSFKIVVLDWSPNQPTFE